LAQSGHPDALNQCPLLGVRRTSIVSGSTSGDGSSADRKNETRRAGSSAVAPRPIPHDAEEELAPRDESNHASAGGTGLRRNGCFSLAQFATTILMPPLGWEKRVKCERPPGEAASCGALGEPTDQKKFACRLRSQFSLQYRVRYARQVFPSFERRDPKRTCLLTCGPFLLARGTPELALYIRLWRAYNDLRAHPTEKP